LLFLQGCLEGHLGQWHIAENEPVAARFLAPGAGVDGDGRRFGPAVTGAVGEAVILSAHREGAAALSAPVEILALVVGEPLRLMAAAKALAGQSAIGTGLAFVERGAEARHGIDLRKWKRPLG